MINGVKLYTKKQKHAIEIEKLVKEELLANNINISDESYSLAISIGGDGTFLKMVHDNNFNNNIYYVGINAGSLGYLSSINILDIKSFIKSLNINFKEYEIPVLKTIIKTNNETKEYLSINEFTIRKNNFMTMRSNVYINDQLLEKYAGDGLIIGTSTGSTGYSYSFNGPIIDNDLKTLLLTPIAPINNQVYKSLNTPLVLLNNKKIKINFDDNNNLCIVNDGKIENIDNIKEITSELSNMNIKCIIPNEHNYLDILKSKIIGNKD